MTRKATGWPDLPKRRWSRVLAVEVAAPTDWPAVPLPDGCTLTPDEAPAVYPDELARTLAAGQRHWLLQVPVTPDAPIDLTLPASGVLRVTVAAGVTVHLRAGRSGDAAEQQRALVLLDVAANAHVRYDTIDVPEGDLVLYRHATLADGATLNWHAAVLGTASGVTYHAVALKGTGSRATTNVAALSGAGTRMTVTTAVTNFGRHTQGLINQHGVLTGDARLTINGIGRIVFGAQGSDAQQENRVLMLSDQAVGEANPLLLIDENDVTAGHAASVAAVDQAQLYYLQSRGLSRPVALQLVVRGFLLSLLPEDLAPEQQRRVQRAIAAQLDSKEIL